MPFNSESTKVSIKKFKRKLLKKDSSNIKEKIVFFHEMLLDDLLAKQDKLDKTKRALLYVPLSGYFFKEKNLFKISLYSNNKKKMR